MRVPYSTKQKRAYRNAEKRMKTLQKNPKKWGEEEAKMKELQEKFLKDKEK